MSVGGYDVDPERGFSRLASAAGFLFVALSVAAGLVVDLPSIDSRAVEIAAYFDDEHVGVVTFVYLQGLALSCFLFFLAGLAIRLRRAGEQWLGAALFGAGLSVVLSSGRRRWSLELWRTGRRTTPRLRKACST
jgi:hypothetical protein